MSPDFAEIVKPVIGHRKSKIVRRAAPPRRTPIIDSRFSILDFKISASTASAHRWTSP